MVMVTAKKKRGPENKPPHETPQHTRGGGGRTLWGRQSYLPALLAHAEVKGDLSERIGAGVVHLLARDPTDSFQIEA